MTSEQWLDKAEEIVVTLRLATPGRAPVGRGGPPGLTPRQRGLLYILLAEQGRRLSALRDVAAS